ncbi:MAG: hypothetical protein UR52_C0009G0012 [Candidatus Gottesmanbacteria bacterium GW2011_GWA1_34_13]|uniref:Uncharacterized protein n=1 Tax=Candidatus Gottesmanbacteria bacterium GW2011_GWA1_34_13 TaxID=1618434 RepID=A0A0G0AQW8_9BACT|nr:MAG: hypothetical protein UR52_C0009G0012 [Candidatus Gottesmanbacteria bacterium GW2011_GWA1_34_13]
MRNIIALIIIVVLLIIPAKIFAQRTDIDPPVTKKVMVINFNPIIESYNSQRLTYVNGWNDTNLLNFQYINDVRQVSGGYANYQIVENLTVDDFPTKADGFKYTDITYMQCWQNHDTCHVADGVNYNKILTDYDVCGKRNRGEIDELWIFGGPWFGYWESTMAGPNSFWLNSVPLTNTSCTKQLIIMGYNYERNVAEMIENLGHRTESVMRYVYGSWQYPPHHDWDKFTVYDKEAPGLAACGNVHYAPNSDTDYNWSNTRQVDSSCDDWFNYPNLTGAKTQVSCLTWSCNEWDGYTYKKWWFNHLPRYSGTTNGKWNNWWRYILDYEQAMTGQPYPSDNPFYTWSNLKNIITNYLSSLDTGYRFADFKLNIMDLGYIISRIRP